MLDVIVPVNNLNYSSYTINADDTVEAKIVAEDSVASKQFILETLADFLSSTIKAITSARQETHGALRIFKHG